MLLVTMHTASGRPPIFVGVLVLYAMVKLWQMYVLAFFEGVVSRVGKILFTGSSNFWKEVHFPYHMGRLLPRINDRP